MEINEIRKNVHQTHMEDLVLLGTDGLKELNNYIKDNLNQATSKTIKTTKIDGAPALLIGHNVPGYPKEFVGIKSVLNDPENAYSSDEEIDAKKPGIANEMKLGLRLAKYIPDGEIWQGDVLFTKGDVKEQNINGKDYLVFQPNTVVYAFSEDNPDYDKLKNADFGIAFHTRYKGKAGEFKQSFNINPEVLNVPKNVFILSPVLNYNKENVKVDRLEDEYLQLVELENKLVVDPKYEDLCNNEFFIKYWNMFENSVISDRKVTKIDVSTFIKDLNDYIDQKMLAEFNDKEAKLKTQRGKDKAKENYLIALQEAKDLVENNKRTLVNLVNCLNKVVDIKAMLINWFDSKPGYDTYLQSRTKGYLPSKGEGIAMSDQDGNIVKLVDRSEFSNANRNSDIVKGFEHESYDPDNMVNTVANTDKDPSVIATKKYHKMKDKKLKPGQMVANAGGLGEELLDEKIVKKGSKWQVQSEKGRNMGTYDTKEEAEKRLKQVHYFKYKNEELNEDVNPNDKKIYNLVYDKLLDIAEDSRLRKKNNHKHYETIRDFLKKQYRGNKLSHTMFNKLNRLVDTYDKMRYEELTESNDKVIRVNVYIDDLSGDVVSGNRDDYDEQTINEWWEFVDEVEEYLEDNFDVISTSASNSRNSLSEYIDFYKTDENGNREKYLIDLRLSDHKQSSDAKRLRRKKVNELNPDNRLITVTVNDKMFDSYGEALDKIKQLIGSTNKVSEVLTDIEKLHLEEDAGKKVYFTMGKFNPPTIGHKKMVNYLMNIAKDGEARVYATHRQGPDQPLSYKRKIEWMRKAFPEANVVESNAANPFDVLFDLYNEGVTDVVYIGGEDRVKDLTNTMRKGNGVHWKDGRYYNFRTIGPDMRDAEKIANDLRRVEGEGEEGASSTKLRQLVRDNNLEEFKANVPFENDDAERLFKEVKQGMGLQESTITESSFTSAKIAEDKYYSRVVDDFLGNGILDNKGNLHKLNNPKDKKKVRDELMALQQGLSKSDKSSVKRFYEITGMKISDIEKAVYSGSSKTGEKKDLGFVVNNKTLTPMKVFNPLDTYVPLNKIPSGVKFSDSNDEELNNKITELLQTVTRDCMVNVRITGNKEVLDYMKKPTITAPSNNFSLYTEYNVKPLLEKFGYNILSDLRSPFKNNFGEIFGAAALASALSKKTYIKFPGASNYPIADYIISDTGNDNGSFKVSAKAAKLGKAGTPVSEGGKPGCGPIINDIYKGFKEGTLDKKAFTKDFIDFIVFMENNIYLPEGIHKTYENLANSLANPPKWLKINVPSELQKFTVPGSVNSKNIKLFAGLFKKEKEIKPDLVRDRVYCDAFRVKYMAQLFIKALNNNQSIIEQFTKAISLLFGVFIQLYIDDNSDFVNGKIKMFGEVVAADGEPLKINGRGYHYEFLDNSSFNKKHQLDTTKLSMKLKQ